MSSEDDESPVGESSKESRSTGWGQAKRVTMSGVESVDTAVVKEDGDSNTPTSIGTEATAAESPVMENCRSDKRGGSTNQGA